MRRGAALALVAAIASGETALEASPARARSGVHCEKQHLQAAIDAAPEGSTLTVSGTCVGHFSVDKKLTIRRAAALTGSVRAPWSSGAVVTVGSGVEVQWVDLTTTHGNDVLGGGIWNN